MVDLPTAAQRVPRDVVLIGNLDTVRVMIDQTPNQVYRATRDLMDAMAPYPNFIVSTACDLPMETPLENIHAMIEAVRAGSHPGDAPWLDVDDDPVANIMVPASL